MISEVSTAEPQRGPQARVYGQTTLVSPRNGWPLNNLATLGHGTAGRMELRSSGSQIWGQLELIAFSVNVIRNKQDVKNVFKVVK